MPFETKDNYIKWNENQRYNKQIKIKTENDPERFRWD